MTGGAGLGRLTSVDVFAPGGPQLLAEFYEVGVPDRGPWVRANMLMTLDGAAAGADGRSGSIGSAADKVAFDVLRRLADVVVVGAGTVRAEEYGLPSRVVGPGGVRSPELAVVTRSWQVPARLADRGDGAWLLGPSGSVPRDVRAAFGDRVVQAGDPDVDLRGVLDVLAARGLAKVLLEGGPKLLASALAAGVVDELCLTLTPLVVAGDGPRITAGQAITVGADLRHVVECGSTLLTRWAVGHPR